MIGPVLPRFTGPVNPRPSMLVMPRDKPRPVRSGDSQVMSTREVRVAPSGSKRGSDVAETSGTRTCEMTAAVDDSACAHAPVLQRQGAIVANNKAHGLEIAFNPRIRHTTTALMTPPNSRRTLGLQYADSLSDTAHDCSQSRGGAPLVAE